MRTFLRGLEVVPEIVPGSFLGLDFVGVGAATAGSMHSPYAGGGRPSEFQV